MKNATDFKQDRRLILVELNNTASNKLTNFFDKKKWTKILRAAANLSLYTAILCLVSLTLGFFLFSHNIENSTKTKTPPKSDAIVVLTGGANRIQTAFALMDKNLGERLLITGVNWRTSKSAIFGALNRDINNSKLKVDIDHLALDTLGNAKETANWAKRHNYKKLIIVTSNFHMSRSLLEFKLAMPDIEFISYPAFENKNNSTTHKSGQKLRFNLREYGKLVAASLRIHIFEKLPLTKLANAY